MDVPSSSSASSCTPAFGAVAGGAAFGAAADAISASEEEAGDACGDGAHVTRTEGQLLVLSELNSVLIWRDYSGGSGLSGCETVEMRSGKMIRMFIRPGALALVALLLRSHHTSANCLHIRHSPSSR